MAQVAFGTAENETHSIDFLNKRTAHRRRMLKSGSIIINEGYSKFNCIVRNLNENGAMLEMTDVTGLPSAFELNVGEDDFSCKVGIVWKSGTRIGVAFL